MLCPIGHYQSQQNFNGNSCSQCNPGTYAEYMGSHSCSHCPAGSYSGAGATSSSGCIPCPQGRQ